MTDLITELPPIAPRPSDAHKDSAGRVGVFGGCAGLSEGASVRIIGAPVLAAHGARGAGAGVVHIAAPEPIIDSAITLAPFAVGHPVAVDPDGTVVACEAAVVVDTLVGACDALVLGPGLGRSEPVRQTVMRSIAREMSPRCKVWVLDADALWALSESGSVTEDLRVPCVITPHPGEAARLLSSLSLSEDPKGDDDARRGACEALARRLGVLCVLKGERTVVSDGHRSWICGDGHPALATGGTGDVLAGCVGALCGSPFDNGSGGGRPELFHLVCHAVRAHARAGASWAIEHGTDRGLDPLELAGLLGRSLLTNP